MQRAIGIKGIDGESIAYAGWDAEVVGIGSINELALGIEHQYAQAARTIEGIERISLQICVSRWLAAARQICCELPQFTALPHSFRIAFLLSGLCEEVGRQHVIGTVLHEDYFAVPGVLLNGCERAVYLALTHGHGMRAVVLNVHISEGDEEAVDGEELSEVLLCYLTHFTHKLLRTVGAACRPQLQWVFAQGLEQVGIERGILLCQMIVEVQLPVHVHLAFNIADEEGFVASIFLHDHRQRRANGCDQAVEVSDVV